MSHSSRSTLSKVVGVLGPLCILGAVGGGVVGASQPPGTAGSESTAGSDDPFAGCGDDAVTDPADLEAGRSVARCESGYPLAIPLDEPDTFTVALRPHLVWAPILLADALGEFEKENVEVEFIEVSHNDALSEVGRGELDAAAGGAQAVWFNSVNAGFDLHWSIANFFPNAAGDATTAQTGLWARRDTFSDPENPDIAELAGTTFGTAVLGGNTTMYFIDRAFDGSGIGIADLEVQTVPPADMVQAFESGAIQSAWVIDPFWQELATQSDDYVLLATQTPGEPIGGLFTGPNCEGDRRDTCVAVYRAIVRTVNTYFQDGLDPEVAETLAGVLGQDVDSVAAASEMTFDWEIRDGTAERIQQVFIDLATDLGEPIVEFDSPLPEEDLIDRSLYLEAIGQSESS